MEQRSSTFGPWTGISCQTSSGIRLEIKCTINVICLNCPETIPPPLSVEKLSSTKSISCTKKVGDHWCRGPSEKDKGHSWQLPNCPVRHGGGERLLSVKETLCHLHFVHPNRAGGCGCLFQEQKQEDKPAVSSHTEVADNRSSY